MDSAESQAGRGFPGMGRRYLATFPEFCAELEFAPPCSLTWTLLDGNGRHGRCETVQVRVDEVGHGLFLVSWIESNGTHVAHVEDFGRHTVATHVTRRDGSFLRTKGTFVERGSGPGD